jgi:lipopolysaccharide assembly outer membrane protein LptD (OstA)
VIRLVLDADHMIRYDDPDSLYTVFQRSDAGEARVKASFFDSLGLPTGTLTAERIMFDETGHVMIATGDVILQSEDGRRLQSEKIIWDEEARSGHAPGYVSLTTEDQNIRGYELDASEDLARWKLKRPTGTVRIREQ